MSKNFSSGNLSSENPLSENLTTDKVCVVIGASHAGVNFAFALRREGWQGEIILFDADPELPYHRPPLSKAYLSGDDGIEKNLLKPAASYEKENIQLHLGQKATAIDKVGKRIILDGGRSLRYDILVLATGARAVIPHISGLETLGHVFPMRTAEDANAIRTAVKASSRKNIVVIGGGFIGLETAASLKKLEAKVIVLEREDRVLARVTATEVSAFFQELHARNEVDIFTGKTVVSVENCGDHSEIRCADGSKYEADMIIIGVGIHVNTRLAEQAGLIVENGIRVDATARTNDDAIYAIGDCTFHYNPHYKRFIRLESVQNAVDQAHIAAAAICGKHPIYDSIPWFWSDQYDIKLQMVGLSQGYDEVVVRNELNKEDCFSVWYFKKDVLLAVDAVNNAKAYVYGTKFIKEGQKLDKGKLADASTEFKPLNLLRL